MRIITGKYKGANLFTVPGSTTRPTTDYQRELLFSMYQDYAGLRVLDLYAGTGSFGLECLSRDAVWADFVEFSHKALAVLLKNVAKLRCGDICHVHRKKVAAFLSTTDQHWDIIYLDPPYSRNLVNPTLQIIYDKSLLTPEGLLMVEHSPAEPLHTSFQPYIINQRSNKITAFTILSFTQKD